MSDTPEDAAQELSRRDFINRAIIGVSSIVTGGIAAKTGADYYKAKHRNELLKKHLGAFSEEEEKEDALPPATQEHINQFYTQLYDKIEAAKDAASKAGTSLNIIIGENHAHYDSLLVNAMVIDIASKLGIKNYVTEAVLNQEDADKCNKLSGSGISGVDMNYMSMVRLLAERQAVEGTRNLAGRKRQSIENVIQHGDVEQPDFQHGWNTLNYAMLSDMKFYLGDPNRYDKNGKRNTNAIREVGMIKSLNKVDGHKLSCFGAGHIVSIANGLAKAAHIFPIDCSNSKEASTSVDQFTNETAKQNYVLADIVGREVTPRQLVELFCVASETDKFRRKKRYMNEDDICEEIKLLKEDIDMCWNLEMKHLKQPASSPSR